MKLEYSFHSHTYRCGHATGDIEDYVFLAKNKGYKYYGISDHVFLPGVKQEHTRGDISMFDEYVDSFKKCKEKYKDRINLYLAFECEYADVFLDYYKSLKENENIDYLILGQHMRFDESKNHIWYFGYHDVDNYKGIEDYKNDLIKGMKSGLFLYIAHPDLYLAFTSKITPFIEKITTEIIEASIKYDIPIEINLNGFFRRPLDIEYKTYGYPTDYFWQKAQSMGAKIVVGGDFHRPEIINDDKLIDEFNDFIKRNEIELFDYHKLLKRMKKAAR